MTPEQIRQWADEVRNEREGDSAAETLDEVADDYETNLTRLAALEAALAAVEAERDALRGALAEAADDIEAWGAYASAYFQSKHGLLDCIAKYRAITQEKPA